MFLLTAFLHMQQRTANGHYGPQKSDFSNRCVFTWRAILPNFIPIRFQMTEPWAFLKSVDRPNNKVSSDIKKYDFSMPTWVRVCTGPEHLGIWYHTRNQAPALRYVHSPNISLWFWDMVSDLYPEKKIDALDNWCLRRILHIHWTDFVSTDVVRSRTGQPLLSDTVR